MGVFFTVVIFYTIKLQNSLIVDELKSIAECKNWLISLFWNGISTQSVSVKQNVPNLTSRTGNIYSGVCKSLGEYTREKENLGIPGFLYVFSLSTCYWALLKRGCRTGRTFGLTLFLSSYFICCMLLNNHLSKKRVWSSRAHLFYLTVGVLTEWLSPPCKLDTDTKGL